VRRLSNGAGIELPLALLAGAFFLMQVFQTVMLVRQSRALIAIAANQEAPIAETERLHKASNALAGDVALLAQHGDAGAKQVVDALAHANITLEPPPRPGAPPAAPPAK